MCIRDRYNIMGTRNEETNNNNIEEMRSVKRERVKRQGSNIMKQLIEIEREQKRVEKNEQRRLRRQNMTDD